MPSLRGKVRKRRRVSRSVLKLLWPIFRYTYQRDGWVLRIVGERVGPVLIAHREREPVNDSA